MASETRLQPPKTLSSAPEPEKSASADRQIDQMAFYPHTPSSQFLSPAAFLFVVLAGWFIRLTRRWARSRRRGPILVQPNGPVAPGPIKISGLWVRIRLVYANSPRRCRRVTLYAVAGHRGADGRITLELLQTVCHSLHAPRSFRVDRIISATNMRGEPIHNLSAWVMAVVGMH